MGGRYKAARGKRADTQRRPSLFFIIALAIGLVILAWAAIYSIRHPEKPVPPTSPAKKSAMIYRVG